MAEGATGLLSLAGGSGNLAVKGSLSAADGQGPLLTDTGIANAKKLEGVTSVESEAGQHISLLPGSGGAVKLGAGAALQAGQLHMQDNVLSSLPSSSGSDADLKLEAAGGGKLVMDGKLQLRTHSFACDNSHRGTFLFQQEIVSGGDHLYICMKKSDGTFGYVQVAHS